jgi:transposase
MTIIKSLVIHLSKGKSQRYISDKTGMSRNTVAGYVKRLARSGLDWKQLSGLSEAELAVFAGSEALESVCDSRYEQLRGLFDYLQVELTREGVTRQLLWQEYRAKEANGYEYSQFCAHLAAHTSRKTVTMQLEGIHSCRVEADFAGYKPEILDPETGEIREYPLLVVSFRGSTYTWAEVLANQETGTILAALARCFAYFGGAPAELVTDNLRQIVKKADRYEPEFGEAAEQFAGHYGLELIAARVRKPKDKPVVENGVYQCSLKLVGPLRNVTFRSLEEINAAYAKQLEVLNSAPMQRKSSTRREQFLAMESSKLLALPAEPFKICYRRELKVGRNYHVAFGKRGQYHSYSVPHLLCGKTLAVVYDDRRVQIYQGLTCVAAHPRKYTTSYSTLDEHMPKEHQAQKRGWSPEYFLGQAEKTGPMLKIFIQKALESKLRVEHSFTKCRGILSLNEKYTPERLEKAASMLLEKGKISYGALHRLLKNRWDLRINEPVIEPCIPRNHGNIRGKEQMFLFGNNNNNNDHETEKHTL